MKPLKPPKPPMGQEEIGCFIGAFIALVGLIGFGNFGYGFYRIYFGEWTQAATLFLAAIASFLIVLFGFLLMFYLAIAEHGLPVRGGIVLTKEIDTEIDTGAP